MVDFNDFAPAPRAVPGPEADPVAQAGPVAAAKPKRPRSRAKPAAPVLAAPDTRVAAFVLPRSRTFPLDHPITYGDRVYDAITLRRPTSVEVGAFFEATLANDGIPPSRHFPIFVDADGAPIPDAVLDHMDDDDDVRVSKAVTDFLPQRFRSYRERMQSDATPSAGDPTEPT